MTVLALPFQSPWLLLGLLAAGVPPLLHLLSSLRAPSVAFPTLRFLRNSMARTMRRRRVHNWLLMLMRCLLLALLAIGAAEWLMGRSDSWAGDRYAAVLILDESYSMTATIKGGAAGGTTRLAAAREQVQALLGGDATPARAALMLTPPLTAPGPGAAPPASETALTDDLRVLRRQLDKAEPTEGRAAIIARVKQAVRLLNGQALADKRIYLFSDLQQVSFADLANMPELRDHPDIRLLVIHPAGRQVEDVGIVALDITGPLVVDQELAFTATLINNSRGNKKVTLTLWADEKVGPKLETVSLPGAGGTRAKPVRKTLRHRFRAAGEHTGRIVVTVEDGQDDLAVDNERHFSVQIAERAEALVVGGPANPVAERDGATVLRYALNPRRAAESPWSIAKRPRVIRAAELAAAELAGKDAVYCADMPSVTPAQAEALADYVDRGGVLTLFMGNHVDPDNYNARLGDGGRGLLPARLGDPVGDGALSAPGWPMDRVDLKDPHLADLAKERREYTTIITRRYYQVDTASQTETKVLMALAGPRGVVPLVLTKPFGRGRVVLFATTASLQWTRLSAQEGAFLFVPLLERIALLAPKGYGARHAASQGRPETIPLPPELAAGGQVEVRRLPDGPARPWRRTAIRDNGLYRWRALAGAASGTFAVNPDGQEFDLTAVTPAQVVEQVGAKRCFAAATVADANAAAAVKAAGINTSEWFLMVVILLLVVEAGVSNRRRRAADPALLGNLRPTGEGPAAP